MPIKISVHRLALQHGSSRMHCHRGDLSGYLYHAHCHGNRKSYEMQTLHTEVFVLSCLSHSLFPSPQPWGFYGCFYSEEAWCQPTTCMDSQNLGIPGLDWSSASWSVPSALDPPVLQVLPSPSSVPGHFREWWEVLQQYLKVITVEKDHQGLTHSRPPPSPGMQGMAAVG